MRVRIVRSALVDHVCEGLPGLAERPSLRDPGRVHALARALGWTDSPVEMFCCLLLDGRHRLRGVEEVSKGTATKSLVHPREVFGAAVRLGAVAIICCHNHPSGDPEPSPEDLAVTRRLVDAGKLLGIPMLDHVIVAAGRYVSLRNRGCIS